MKCTRRKIIEKEVMGFRKFLKTMIQTDNDKTSTRKQVYDYSGQLKAQIANDSDKR